MSFNSIVSVLGHHRDELKGPWTAKLTYIFFIHFYDFLIIFIVILATSILLTRRNLRLK